MLQNLKFHFITYKSPPLIPFLSQMNPIYALPPCLMIKIHSHIVPLVHRYCKWCLPAAFSQYFKASELA